MQETWIKLYRKLLASPVFDNPAVLKVWLWALLKANHRGTAIVLGYQTITLNPGEFIFGRITAAEELKMAESTVWRCMAMLKNLGNLDIKSSNKFSVVKINNWTSYQELGQQMKNKRTTSGQQVDTDNNDKNDKNVKKRGTFVPPSLQEVSDYCRLRGNQVNAQTFLDFYVAKGWVVGKNKMVDWQAAVRTWEQRDRDNPKIPHEDDAITKLKQKYGQVPS